MQLTGFIHSCACFHFHALLGEYFLFQQVFYSGINEQQTTE